jgi:histidine triad (HIT) family protein
MPDASDCLFCRIVRGDIPAEIVHETQTAMAFRDVSPQAPTHVLVIPKTHHENAGEHVAADPEGFAELVAVAATVARAEGLAGYRLVVNTGVEGGQSVFHTHLHLLGGRSLTWPPG